MARDSKPLRAVARGTDIESGESPDGTKDRTNLAGLQWIDTFRF